VADGRRAYDRFDVLVDNPAQLEVSDEEDWFGEGSAFDSGEELAAALFAMAGAEREAELVVAPPQAGPAAHPRVAPFDAPFEVIDGMQPVQEVAGVPGAAAPDAPPAPHTWSVRTPGAETLPPRQHGRSGWSIRNSVQVLRRTESVMERLREQAVVAAFAAAARALSLER